MSGLLAVAFLDRATDYVSGSPVTYAVVAAVSAIDAFFPLVPSETAVITAGTLAASGDLLLYLLLPAAAIGAFVGDNVTYAVGATLGERASGKVLSGDRGRRRLEWAQRMLDRHGALIILGARFVPGGRTATTFAAGTLEFAWRRFAAYDAVACALWATYGVMIGYLGGSTFRKETWKALALGFGIALAVAGLIELARRIQSWRGSDLLA
jgi:membrane protein DedA with SNARE-associated domain